MRHRITIAAIALCLFVSSSSEAQIRRRQKKAAVSERTLALYEPGEYDGVISGQILVTTSSAISLRYFLQAASSQSKRWRSRSYLNAICVQGSR